MWVRDCGSEEWCWGGTVGVRDGVGEGWCGRGRGSKGCCNRGSLEVSRD